MSGGWMASPSCEMHGGRQDTIGSPRRVAWWVVGGGGDDNMDDGDMDDDNYNDNVDILGDVRGAGDESNDDYEKDGIM